MLKLPGSGTGWCGDRFSFQLREHRYALFGRITWNGSPLLVVVTHLHHTRPLDPEAIETIRDARRRGVLSGPACDRLLIEYETGVNRRERQLDAITAHLHRLAPHGRMILCGDFNAEPGSPEIRTLVQEHGLIDTYAQAGMRPGHTWDPERNPNTAASCGAFLGRDITHADIRDLLSHQDMRPGRLDYIFLGPGFSPAQVASSERFATRPAPGGLFCSDHFGVLTTVRFSQAQPASRDPSHTYPVPNAGAAS